MTPMYVSLYPDPDSHVRADAWVTPMPQGDLVVSLRRPGAHPDDEVAIVVIAVEQAGTFRVTVLNGDAAEVGRIEVRP
jgi:hypothetical protein